MKKFSKKWPINFLRLFTNISWYLLWFVLITMTPVFVGDLIGIDILEGAITTMLEESEIEFLSSSINLSSLMIEVLVFLYSLITVVIALFVIYQFRQLFKALKTGEFFTEDNVRSFQKIAYPSIFLALLEFDGSGIYWALILLVFVEIFRHGVALEEDRKLTI